MFKYCGVNLMILFFGWNECNAEDTSFVFTPSSLTADFGEVELVKGSVDSANNRWKFVGDQTDSNIDMALKATVYSGEYCDINNINVTFDADVDPTEDRDAGLIVSVGSEYFSILFDWNGGVIIGGDIPIGGVGIYPKCGSTSLGIIPDNSIEANDLFNPDYDIHDDTGSTRYFYNWRDGMAGGNRDNWGILNKDRVGGTQRDQFSIGYLNDPINNKLSVKFTSYRISDNNLYEASCDFDTSFSFENDNDVHIYFTPDHDTGEVWYINSMTISTDCSLATETSQPTALPTPAPIETKPKPKNCKCDDNIKKCKNKGCVGDEDDNKYCEEYDESNGSCNKCECGYFMKSKNHKCVKCKDAITGCVSCLDGQGCIQCDYENNWEYFWDKKCKIGRCKKVIKNRNKRKNRKERKNKEEKEEEEEEEEE